MAIFTDPVLGKLLIGSFWSDEAACRASDEALAEQRAKMLNPFAATLGSEIFKVTVVHQARQPGPGAAMRRMIAEFDPAETDTRLEAFRAISPLLDAMPGAWGFTVQYWTARPWRTCSHSPGARKTMPNGTARAARPGRHLVDHRVRRRSRDRAPRRPGPDRRRGRGSGARHRALHGPVDRADATGRHAPRRRVFLAGDAAHLNPPFGGHGLNTGIGDAVDLGWKLAAVLQGWGGPGLLESYEAERRPVQDRVIRAASENMRTLSTDLVAEDLDVDSRPGTVPAAQLTGASRRPRAPSSTLWTSSSPSSTGAPPGSAAAACSSTALGAGRCSG